MHELYLLLVAVIASIAGLCVGVASLIAAIKRPFNLPYVGTVMATLLTLIGVATLVGYLLIVAGR